MTDYDARAANQLEAWMAVQDIDHDTLEEQFQDSHDYDDALSAYVEDFRYSADYEHAYERWLHDKMEDE